MSHNPKPLGEGIVRNLWLLTLALSLAILPTLSIAEDWQPGGKEESWVDLNFVPCEGMGATASGNIEVRVGYNKKDDVLNIVDWQLRTRYFHPHSPSAKLEWNEPSGATRSMNLEPAWFAIIGPNDGSRYLFLARDGNREGAAGQTSFKMKSGTKVKISVNALFPQFGGNCVGSFSETLRLP